MGDQIAFPYNYESYVNKGMAALHAGNSSQAAEYFEKALAIQYSDEVLVFYLMIIQETEREHEAVELLQELAPWLWQSQTMHDVDRLFLELLLQVDELEEAETQLAARYKHFPNHNQEDVMLQLEDKLQHRKEARKLKKRRLQKQLQEEQQEVLGGGFLAMNAFLLHCKELTNQDYTSLCLPLLADDRVHALHKTEILQALMDRSIFQECLVKKGLLSKTVDLSSLPPVSEVPFYLAGQQLLEDRTDLKEEMKAALARNLFLHTAYYYPFEEEVFPSAEQWFDAVVSLQEGTEASSSSVVERVSEAERVMNELAGL